jgi:nicotinamide phosphoribosyltransferase
MNNYSADNIAFGQGGALLQQINRDTLKFAMKCSAAKINGEWVPVYKDPITDHGKVSKKGRVTLYQNSAGKFYSGVEDWEKPALVEVFRDGVIIKEYTFAEIRENARQEL